MYPLAVYKTVVLYSKSAMHKNKNDDLSAIILKNMQKISVFSLYGKNFTLYTNYFSTYQVIKVSNISRQTLTPEY